MTVREDQFLYYLQHARSGELLRELSRQLAECKNAAELAGKPAAMTLQLVIAPRGRQFLISDKIAAKLPTGERDVTVMFVDEHGNFTRKDPSQRELPLRSADDAPDSLREIV